MAQWSQGNQWVTVVATNTRYPSDGAGAGVASAASSMLVSGGEVLLVGVQMTQPTVNDAFEIVDGAGTTLTGLTWVVKDVATAGPFIPAPGIVVNKNIGLKASVLTAGAVNMFFKKLS